MEEESHYYGGALLAGKKKYTYDVKTDRAVVSAAVKVL